MSGSVSNGGRRPIRSCAACGTEEFVMRVLTLNPGSSSMKVSMVVDGVAVGWAAWDLTNPKSVPDALARWYDVDVVAVRFVHGGSQKDPALVDDPLLVNPERLNALAANQHQPVLSVTFG